MRSDEQSVSVTVDTDAKPETEDGSRPADNAEYTEGVELVILIVALCMGMFLVALDNTIIAVAVPKISTDFHALDDVAWYGSIYLLTLTALQPSLGKLYRILPSKAVYLGSVVIFEVGSVLCAAAPSSPIFILGRAIAGTGAAGLMQGALQVISLCVPVEKRPMYFGIVVAVFGPAVCLGPVIGGVFTDKVTWRWCFWINLPIGGVCFFLLLFFMKIQTSAIAQRERTSWTARLIDFDLPGAALMLGSICCLLFALQWGGVTKPWNSSVVIGLFVGFALMMVAFLLVQWRLGDRATIPLQLLKQRSVVCGSFFLFFLQMTNFTDTYYVPFYFQAAQDVSAEKSGVQYIALVVPQIVAIGATGALITNFRHYVPFMLAGQILYAVGTGLLTTLKVGTSTVTWAAYLVISGIGLGMAMQVPFSAVQVVLSGDDVLVGNAVTIFLSQLGGAIAIGISQSIFVNGLTHYVSKYAGDIVPQAVLSAGATNLRDLTEDPHTLLGLRQAYAAAVSRALLFALVAACVAIPLAVAMEWKKVPKKTEHPSDAPSLSEKGEQRGSA